MTVLNTPLTYTGPQDFPGMNRTRKEEIRDIVLNPKRYQNSKQEKSAKPANVHTKKRQKRRNNDWRALSEGDQKHIEEIRQEIELDLQIKKLNEEPYKKF